MPSTHVTLVDWDAGGVVVTSGDLGAGFVVVSFDFGAGFVVVEVPFATPP